MEEKNKKINFSILELFAILVIIAILVVNMLPSVTKRFDSESKKEFVNEVKEIYKASKGQWEKDNTLIIEERSYSQVNTESLTCDKETYKKLNISTRKDIAYFIKLDKEGNVISYIISNDKLSYRYDGEGLDIEKEDIDKNIKQEKVEINCALLNGETN